MRQKILQWICATEGCKGECVKIEASDCLSYSTALPLFPAAPHGMLRAVVCKLLPSTLLEGSSEGPSQAGAVG